MGLKPSEIRARRQQRQESDVFENSTEAFSTAPERKKRERQNGRWSSFVSEHTMLITFIICMAILLAFISPYNVFYIAEKIKEDVNTVDNRAELDTRGHSRRRRLRTM